MRFRGGFVLVLVVGVMGLLLLAGVGLLQVATQARGATAGLLAASRARLSAASGMEYAASRLTRQGFPRFQNDPDSRGDDWTYRAPVEAPLETSDNPSFSHGEPWRNLAWPYALDGIDNDGDGDADEAGEQNERDDDGDGLVDEPGDGDGVHEPREAYVDLDGDGRFSAWSGRLRGEATPFGLRFSLAVEAGQSKIPLNAGALWEEDLHGYSGSPPGGPNGIPDHRDEMIPYHAGLVRCLNNLGAILRHEDPARLSTRCEDVPTGEAGNPGEPIRVSWLGYDLITLRPVGGYRSWVDVERALLDLPSTPPYQGGPYTRAELDAIRPYLDLGPYEISPGTSRANPNDSPMATVGKRNPFPPYVPILLSRAPRKVLQAVWMYLGSYTTAAPFVGFKGHWTQVTCGRTGDPAGSSTLSYAQLNLSRDPNGGIQVQAIFPDEAEALADAASRFRQRPDGFLWRALYQTLVQEAPTIFRQDFEELDDPSYPMNARSWAQGKADLAFLSVCMDPSIGGLNPFGSATWGSWGIDRDGDPTNGVQPNQAFDAYVHCFVKHPEAFPAGPWWVRHQFNPLMDRKDPYAPFIQLFTGKRAQGVTLAPPCAFRVESIGHALAGAGCFLRLRAGFRAGETMELGSEEDFDNIEGEYFEPLGQGTWASRGISVHDGNPAARHDLFTDASLSPQRQYPSVATLPRFNRRAYCGTRVNAVHGANGAIGFRGCSPYYGAVTLAPYEGGRWNAVQYWPFQDDFDWDPGPLAPTSTFGTDFWSEPGPGSDRLRLPCDPFGWVQDGFPPWLWSTPWGFTSHPVWRCPGFEGTYVSGATLECWMTSGSNLHLWGDGWSNSIVLETRRVQYEDEEYATGFFLTVSWTTDAAMAMSATSFPPIVVPDSALADGSPRMRWTYHVVMEIERLPPGLGTDMTRFRFFINGRDRDPSFGLPYELDFYEQDAAGNKDGKMKATDKEYLCGLAIDELRVYPGFIGLSGARQRNAQGRFVRQGGFTSPLYAFDRPVRMSSGAWTGLAPPELFRTGAGGNPVPFDPFTVKAIGFRTRPGDPAHPQPAGGIEVPIQKDAVGDLSGLGLIRSLQYRVEIDCRDLIGPLDDTPVFESIWISFQREGRAGRWDGWSQR